MAVTRHEHDSSVAVAYALLLYCPEDTTVFITHIMREERLLRAQMLE